MINTQKNRLGRRLDNILSSMSNRAQNCCRSIGIFSIQELAKYASLNDFAKVKNCGPKTAMELNEIVTTYYPNYRELFSSKTYQRYNSNLHDDSNKPKSNERSCSLSLKISKPLEMQINDIYDSELLICDDDIIFSTICSKHPSAISFFDTIITSPATIFGIETSLSITKNSDIWDKQIEILYKASLLLPEVNRQDYLFIRKVHEAYKFVKSSYKIFYNKLIFSKIPPKAHNLINAQFESNTKKLSKKAQRVLNKHKINYITILDYLELKDLKKNIYHSSNYNYFISRFKGYKDFFINEIYTEFVFMFSDYQDFIYDVISYSEEVLDRLIIKNRYTFLSEVQKENVYSFFLNNNAYPFFYILFCAIIDSEDRDIQIFNRVNGISCEASNLTDIAKQFNLSRERVRQLTTNFKPKLLKDIISELPVHQYPFLKNEIIDVTSIFAIIANSEFSNVENFNIYSFVQLLRLISEHKFYNFGECKFLFSSKLNRAFDWKNAWKDITKTFGTKTIEDVEIPIDIFLTNYILTTRTDYSIIRKTLAKIISTNFDATIDDNYIVHLPKNSIEIENELYNIIKEAKKPLSLKEITNLFFKKFPAQSNKAVATLKIYMINSERIKSVGKTSTYTLSEWNFSTKTLRSLIAEILLESDTPLSLDTIVDILVTRGRKTSRNSINSNILSDTKYNFVKFKGGLVGIGGKTYAPIYKIQSPESIARKSFSLRLRELINFVDTYHHFPFSSRDEAESSLYRWQRNIEKGIIDISASEMKQYQDEVNRRKQFMLTSREYAFLQKCADFKYFVSTEFELPNQKTNQPLYLWFLKARRQAFTYKGKKAELFAELIDFLSQYGFTFESI